MSYDPLNQKRLPRRTRRNPEGTSVVKVRQLLAVGLALLALGGLGGAPDAGPVDVVGSAAAEDDPCAVANPNGNVTVYPENCVHD